VVLVDKQVGLMAWSSLQAQFSQCLVCHRRSSELSKRTHSSLSSNQSLREEDIEFALDDQHRRVVLGAGAYGKVSVFIPDSGVPYGS
jgi:hypothetical protein